jgi:formate dehydrogenase iron-sulfur subunit
MYSILVDVTKCIACEKCVIACVERNKLNPGLAEHDRATTRDGLSENRLSTILKVSDERFARKSCMHCVEPSCVSACLVGGITKSPEGPVVYDSDKCIGCRYCMLACPFHIPRYQWDKISPLMVKCDMCYDRVIDNRLPACVEACPQGVLEFGERDPLLKTAKTRIQQNPSKYINHIWGEKEFGGTSVMYISDVDLAGIGWPKYEPEAIPRLTEPLIHKTPFIGLSVALGLVSINWIIKRRIKLADEKNHMPIKHDSTGEIENDK